MQLKCKLEKVILYLKEHKWVNIRIANSSVYEHESVMSSGSKRIFFSLQEDKQNLVIDSELFLTTGKLPRF